MTDNTRLHFNPLPLTCACDEIDCKIDGHELALAFAKSTAQSHRVISQGCQKRTMDQAPTVAMRGSRNNSHVNHVTNPF